MVILGLLAILCLLAHSLYFKRGVRGRNHGFPAVATRVSWLLLDKMVSAVAMKSGQFIGIKWVRLYLLERPG